MSLGTFFDGSTPDQLRGLVWLSLSDVGHIVTQTVTDDGGGGGTTAWVAGTVAIPCRIDPIAARRGSDLTGGRIDERSTHLVTVPAGTDLQADDQLAITNRGTFEVTATRERTREVTRVVEVVAT